MTSPVHGCFMFCVVALLQIGAAAKTPASTLTKKDRAIFAWFDSLGIEDFSKMPLVRVRTGEVLGGPMDRHHLMDEPRVFLVREDRDHLEGLLGDLTSIWMQRAGNDPRDEDYRRWRKVKYADEAAALERGSKKEIGSDWRDNHDASMDQLSEPGQLFVLARYGYAHGNFSSAARLIRKCERYYEAKTMPIFDRRWRTISEIFSTGGRLWPWMT